MRMEQSTFPFAPKASADLGLRPYQEEGRRCNARELRKPAVRATMDVMATGLGKTQLAVSTIKDWAWISRDLGLPNRVLWMAHRDELLGQAQRRIESMLGELTSLEQAGWYASGTRVVVGSVQSMKGKRLERFPADAFGLIVTDEAHRSVAPSYRAIYDHYASAKILGLTATPDRLDKIGQHNVYDSVAFRKDITSGIDEGYLVPTRTRSALIDSVDLAKVAPSGGDLKLEALEEEILKGAAAIADATVAEAEDRRTLIFTPGVASAHKVCDTLNTRFPGSAHVVDERTPRDKRREILAAHRRGEFQYLVNCLVFTEGYDDPGLRAIVSARPTKSRALATQMWGRGLRPVIGEIRDLRDRLSAIATSSKPDCLLLDATGEPGKHKLISPLDVLGGKYLPEEVAKAKEEVAKGQRDTQEALEHARVMIREEEEERRRQEAAAAAAADVRRRSGTWDPFLDGGVRDPDAMRPRFLARPASPALRSWAAHNMLDPNLSHDQLYKLRRDAAMREKFGKASFRQLGQLRAIGITDMNISAENARVLLSGRSA